MTQAKILELRMEFLVDAISKCHMAVATRKRWKEIEASMDAVEIAWDRIKRTSSELGSHDLNLDHLPMMVEMVLRKATKYLAKAQAKMEKWWEAQVQALEAEKASEQPRETSYEMPCDDEDRGKELNAKVDEVALEVSTVNKENEVALEVSNVREESGMACSNKKVAPEVSRTMIKVVKLDEVKIGMNIKAQVEIIAEALEEQNGAKVWEPSESGVAKFDEVKSDVNAEAKVEVSGVKEVMQLDGLTMMKMNEQSRCANWDPGEVVNVKEQIEMLDVKEAEILVNIIDKVGLRLFMKEVWSSGGATEKALLMVMFLLRFVNGFRRKCPIELSDNG